LNKDCLLSLELYADLGQAIEFRCVTNETSKFNRIQHKLPNGTIETLLSNDHVNTNYQRTEMRVEKFNNVYSIRIDPVKYHSAGLYICEDDISIENRRNHMASIMVRVTCIFYSFFYFAL